jgi:drug/metabolite transporter (DMT)-like permease
MAIIEHVDSRRTGVLDRLWQSPCLLLSLAALFWSGNFIVGRAIHDAVPPIALAFWRWTAGFAILLPFAWTHLRRDVAVLLRHRWSLVALSMLGITAYNALIYVGLRSTTAINALLMQSIIPVLIPLCAFAVFRERPLATQLLGVAVSKLGIVVIVAQGSLQLLRALHLNSGDIWVLVAVAAYALYSVLLRKRPPVHPLSFLAASIAVGAILLLPAYLWETVAVGPFRPTTHALLAIAYLAVFPSVLAYLCFNRGVELLGSSRAGLFIHLMPVFGSFLAVAFLGETLHPFHIAGMLCIAAGICIALRR